MKARWILALLAILGVGIFALTGCATQRIDWNTRVGTYTRDDAIREYGPPEKSASLSDGTTVADWLTSRGARHATSMGGYGYVGYPHAPRIWSSPGYVVIDAPGPDRFLRLTFDPQGKLVSWKRVYQ